MTSQHPSRLGMTFQLSPGHRLYIGPSPDGKGPILALVKPRAKRPTTIAVFRNATYATDLIDALTAHFDAITTKPVEPDAESTQQTEPSTGSAGRQ